MLNKTMKNKLVKAVIFALLGLVCWIAVAKVTSYIKRPDTQNSVNQKQLLMEWQEVVATGVSSDEKDRIFSFVDTFERAVAQRDGDKALSFFSAPETDEEQKELDFILGADLARVGVTNSARLFTTAGYNFSLAAHYVRTVTAQGANTRVLVDEMRVIPSGGEWVGYISQVSRLVVELRETSHGYEIAEYYHEKPLSERERSKYEGFIAE